jgi:hypothetical protein
MLSRPLLDRELHRALAEAGYAHLPEYVERYMPDDVPATSDPVGLPWLMEFREFGDDLAGEYFSGVKDAAGKTVRVKGFALAGGDRVEDALANTAAIVEAVNSRAALKAENERLRKALREIASLKAEDMYMADDDDNTAAYIARAALDRP